jgi:hypothetical protein
LVLALERVTVLVLGGAGGASGGAEDASGSGVMVCWLLQRSSCWVTQNLKILLENQKQTTTKLTEIAG